MGSTRPQEARAPQAGAAPAGQGRAAGFTMVELLVVLAIVALLVGIVTPRYVDHVDRSRESALRQTLASARSAIDQFRADQDRYPERLEDLVDKRYLRGLPWDPVAETDAAWILVPPPAGERGLVFDLRSGAPGESRDGKPYADW